MSGELRRQEILRLLRQRGGLSTRELCAHFQISRMTIHRDLKLLEKTEQIVRIHGGLASARPAAEVRCDCQRPLLPHQCSRLQVPQGELCCCCCSCGLAKLVENPPEQLWVRDFMNGQLLLATDGYYLFNSMAVPCCQPSILSFGVEAEILNFRSGFGGAIGRLEQALEFLRLEQALKQK